ncbi:hypothetical protein VHEMI10249 [[Torrubiella] hemipterigena]|uniref:Uncharacterized protein n=1 Tax=[Torrubiella] hemipterigena TaxID=1531966 RepID=A0A0A1TRV6_9HYPO|nr:hypothetical protein VHEMI10249 [[Torrubiella] hemipterigena]
MYLHSILTLAATLAPLVAATPLDTNTQLGDAAIGSRLSRRASCEKWKTDGDIFTKSSDSTIVVSDNMRGPQRFFVPVGRAQNWTHSASINPDDIGDVEALGKSISKDFKVSRNDTSKYVFEIDTAKMGTVGFTPIMECVKGKTTCSGKPVEGEICWPKAGFTDPETSVDGIWALIQH